MITTLHTRVGILILLLGLSFPGALLAQEIVIDSAAPPDAEQGSSLIVEIIGTGFDGTIDDVKFILHCNKKNCPDTGDILVNGFSVKSGSSIEANISISDLAPAESFDIAVRSTRGRGGKGTTFRGENKFTVKLRPNQQLYSCDDLIEEPLGTCNCQFIWNGDASFLPTLLEDCETSETLYLTNRIRGEENGSADGTGQTTITAVPCGVANGQDCSVVGAGNFSGLSVIANAQHQAAIRWLDIRFDDHVVRGCGSGVESAVSFILDEDIPDPKIPDPLGRNSLFNVNNIGIFSEHDPLCNAIEIVRTEWYTNEYSDTSGPDPARDWKIYATDNLISAGSYEQAGIVMLGIMPSESINPPSVFGNTIGAAKCGFSGNPVGIRFGSLTPDPVNQVDGVVENNVIGMTKSCDDTGIQVVGDPGGEQTTVKVNKNTINGAYLGVKADCNVVEVGFSGNDLSGDNWPTGIFSEAQFTNIKGKPNKISGYVVEIDSDNTGCP